MKNNVVLEAFKITLLVGEFCIFQEQSNERSYKLSTTALIVRIYKNKMYSFHGFD